MLARVSLGLLAIAIVAGGTILLGAVLGMDVLAMITRVIQGVPRWSPELKVMGLMLLLVLGIGVYWWTAAFVTGIERIQRAWRVRSIRRS